MNGWVDLGTVGHITYTTSGTGYMWPSVTTTTANTYTWSSNCTYSFTTPTYQYQYEPYRYYQDDEWAGEPYAPGYNAPDPNPVIEPAVAGDVVLPDYNRRLIASVEAEHTTRAQRLQSAESRAEKLLRSMLTADQKAQLTAHGYFEVLGSAGNLYRINWGTAGNVDHIDASGRKAAVLCAHPDMREQWLPKADVMLAQMLALVTDEPAFIRKANVHAGRRPNTDNVIPLRRAA